MKNTTYALNASIFNSEFEYRQLLHPQVFKTLETENYVPDMISNESVQLNYTAMADNSKLLTIIKWTPTAGWYMLNAWDAMIHVI